jgi:homeobox-leucine zipper protein
MELGLSLGDTMADAGRELVLGLGVGGAGARREEQGGRGRRDLEVAAAMGCGSSPEPTMRLALLAPSLGFPWSSDSSESACMSSFCPFSFLGFLACLSEITTEISVLKSGDPICSSAGHLEVSTRGFDVNQAPSSGASAWGAYAAAADDEQEDAAAAGAAVSSSPNDSGGSYPMDFSAPGERGASDAAPGGGGGGSRGSDDDDGGSARKKLRLSKEQAAFLEESFKEHSTLNPVSRSARSIELVFL